ncbi:GNAT family N-acetyltransferase [Chlorobium phaeobacteroides]|jgi:GNAT superfamily N-acetyltransferase|uniref:GCN5-related N-acetyltransferase n=1 Tax=Chlorobium phaeobacteroides (strain DSM 266 / SMG 266 / 2430) TaxID=290317 RepID=A1BG18_CHLPD|nr:GNAT family N-acetyltransferase [Chlorobium phaeobacteroides]ABL65345.1 GCN5-related N-acetyltransferase [Chlorobium phaeobacteroides DSM 266]MBV5327831.1 GNAT family N-acetyltransferase [Chlorobium sp.]
MIAVRTATSCDIDRCAELLGTLFSEEHEFAPDARAQKQGLSMVIGNPSNGIIFVCEVDGAVQGMVMLLFTVSTFLGKKAAILEDMIVEPRWRGKGIGTNLINHATAFAEEEGFGRITLLTDHDNLAALAFYNRQGFIPSEMKVLRKML